MSNLNQFECECGEVVDVYRNLNKKGDVYSLRAKRINGNGKKAPKVIGYSECVILKAGKLPIRFHVGESGRQRVQREKRKKVHAWVRAEYCGVRNIAFTVLDSWLKVTYCPYKYNCFVDVKTGEPVNPIEYQYAICQGRCVYLTNEI